MIKLTRKTLLLIINIVRLITIVAGLYLIFFR
nr:MAG TPA: hypothetical protein [Caudoviricetes sp.]